MPEPTSKASEPRVSKEAGPPVSGRPEIEALAEAVAEAVAVGVALGVAEVVGLALGVYA